MLMSSDSPNMFTVYRILSSSLLSLIVKEPWNRLMSIADIFAALTEDRPYRKAMTPGEALALIQRGAGTMVDARLVEVAKRGLA